MTWRGASLVECAGINRRIEVVHNAIPNCTARDRPLYLLAHDPTLPLPADYAADEADQRGDFNLRPGDAVLFLEVYVRDASEFTDVRLVRGVEVGGHRVQRAEATAVPNGIAALLFHLRNATGTRPSVYFNWGEGNPLLHLIRYILSGDGDVPPLTREIVRRARPSEAARRVRRRVSGCGRPPSEFARSAGSNDLADSPGTGRRKTADRREGMRKTQQKT